MDFKTYHRDKRVFCGPGAVAIITGWPASVAEEAVRVVRSLEGPRFDRTAHGTYRVPQGNRVRGTTPYEVREALAAFGYRMRGARDDSARETARRLGNRQPRPTLRQWITNRLHRDRMYLVVTSNHWMLIKGNRWQDQMRATPQPIGRLDMARTRVKAVYRISAPASLYRPVYRPGTRRRPVAVDGRVRMT